MKKLTGIVCLLALMLTLTACAGAGDWKYEDLPGDYAVCTSHEIQNFCVSDAVVATLVAMPVRNLIFCLL